MPDFYQHRLVTTLHRLTETNLEEQEKRLCEYAAERPLTLVIPSLFSEMEGAALPRILETLARVGFVEEVVLSMNHMTAAQFRKAKALVSGLPQKTTVLWNDGPRLTSLVSQLKIRELDVPQPGKGANLWLAMGYILARGEARVIAAHDADILTYTEELPQRICLPALHPAMGYEFAKGYYGRIAGRLYGRVTRLFAIPFLRALRRMLPGQPLIEFLDSFRFPLSGEFSISSELAAILHLPGHWGLEVGMLCEVYNQTQAGRICQVDLGINYDHKHQRLEADPVRAARLGSDGGEGQSMAESGLARLAGDIARTLFSYLSADGVVLSRGFFVTLKQSYESIGRDYLRRYEDDALINGLPYSRLEEAKAVEVFSHAMSDAVEDYLTGRCEMAKGTNWKRIRAEFPGWEDQLLEAVSADMADESVSQFVRKP